MSNKLFKAKSENEIRKLISKAIKDKSTKIIRITPDIVEINHGGTITFINEKTFKIFNMGVYESYISSEVIRNILKTFCT